MRVKLAAAVLGATLGATGCTSTQTTPPAASAAHGSWQVVPINTPTFPERCAILLNAQTGDTWFYSGDQWHALKRN